MRGVISFILLLFLVESFVIILTLNSLEFEKSSDKLLHSMKLLDFYDTKIKMKRELQNILITGSEIQNPEERIEFISKELENYELNKELNSDYDIDLWCGYINSEIIEELLTSENKPLSVQDMNFKIPMGNKEIHYCSTVLIVDNELNKIKVGRNYGTEFFDLIPAIGFTIKTKDNFLIDVDYIGDL
jgi:hypothetical protein